MSRRADVLAVALLGCGVAAGLTAWLGGPWWAWAATSAPGCAAALIAYAAGGRRTRRR